MLEHSGEVTAPVSNCKGLRFVVPMHGDDRIGSSFIVVIVTFVFVQNEVCIRPWINAQFDGI